MKRSYVSTYFSPKATLEQVIGFIDRAERTLDVMIYAFTHNAVRDALVRAQARGVTVRVVMDWLQTTSRHSLDESLLAAGIRVRRSRIKGGGAMHHKVAICDRGVPGKYAVLVGSFNWTVAGATKNKENISIIRLRASVGAHQSEFDRLWELMREDVTADVTTGKNQHDSKSRR